ncbi:MAG: alpha/beta fold hydrolase [Acidimicrobiia bacterium]|nr:alpha/beta fold hydrolase [Acidimicrobiia bacterium]
MARSHCICLALAVLLPPAGAAAQAPPAEDTQVFVVFLGGTAVGRETVTVTRDDTGLTITGRSVLGPPVNVLVHKAEMRYGTDMTPQRLSIEADVRGSAIRLVATFADGQATVESTENDKPFSKVDTVSPRTLVLPNLFFGMYEALGRRLATTEVGAGLPVYVAPEVEIPMRLRGMTTDRFQVNKDVLELRRYELAVANLGGEVITQVSVDPQGRMVRLTVPVQGLDVVREDIASLSSRPLTHSNPTDEPITIPAEGFNIAGTMTRPTSPPAKAPAVVLIAGSGVSDRDSVVAGVPIMSHIAGALARAGFIVVRYDKRGTGQSGGRAENATIRDFSNDARTVVQWLEKRDDVDSDRVAVVGHSEGAWVALVTAQRERRVDAVVAIAAAASTGAELILEQQAHALDQMEISDEERVSKVDLQKQLQEAVITGRGWEAIPREYHSANTPWFQSLLAFDPARDLGDLDEPLLIVHGELDRQVDASHAERLAALARERSNSPSIDVVTVRGVNHLLVPAETGGLNEYATLADRNVSPEVLKAIADWLTRTLPTR